MNNDKSHFQKYGWIISRNHLNLLKEAKPVIQIIENDSKIKRQEISGKYLQINCLDTKTSSEMKRWVKPFYKNLEMKVKEILGQLGINQEEIENGKLQHLKLLIAPANSSLRQTAHRDGLNKSVYVIAFYLTNHNSTHFSIYPYVTQDLKTVSPEEKTKIPYCYWTDFISKHCTAGDMSIFREDVIHAGPNNLSLQPRYVLFSVFSPKDYKHRDYSQFYPWDFIEEVTYFGSPEHRKCLLDNITRRPWAHYTGRKRKRLQKICYDEKKKTKQKS